MPTVNYAQGNIYTQGLLDCAQWIAGRKDSPTASNYEHFLLGLMNGMALGSRVEFWNASGVLLSRQQVYLWMDNYCAKNPLKHVIEGASVL
jgi:hypothetical protein